MNSSEKYRCVVDKELETFWKNVDKMLINRIFDDRTL